AEGGNKERDARLLEEYVQDHPSDVAARNQLERMQATDVLILPAKEAALAEVKPSTATEPAISLPLPSNWLPPDVDEKVPPVEPGVPCALDELVQQAGKRVEELIKNVDRFAASELLRHEASSNWGWAEVPERRKFDDDESIEHYVPGGYD